MESKPTKKSRLEKQLNVDEKIIYRIKFSKAAAIPHLFSFLLILGLLICGIILLINLTGITFEFVLEEPVILFPVLCVASVVIPISLWAFKHLISAIRALTREGILYESRMFLFDTWFISEYMFEYKYKNIKEILGSKHLWGKICNYGEIYIGTGNESLGLTGYKNHEDVIKLLNKLIDEKKEIEK